MNNEGKMTQQKFMMTVPEQMHRFLEEERKARGLDSIQETVRQIISNQMIREKKS